MTRHTLPDGTHIDYPAEHVRLWTQHDGTVLRSEHYGPWVEVEPLFPAQRCPGCGTEHPGLPCDLQDDLDLETP